MPDSHVGTCGRPGRPALRPVADGHHHVRAYLWTRQRVWADAIAGVFRAAGQLCEVGRCSPVDLGNRVSVMPERCCTASAVAKTCGGVPQVEAAGEELAGGVMPTALDVQLHADRVRGVSDLVSGPVWVPWLSVGGVVGEQVRVICQLDADLREGGPDLVQLGCDERASVWVDGEPAVLVRLGVLTDALTAADNVVEGDVDQALVQVDVTDLQAAELSAACAGDHHKPQVQA